MFAVLNDASNTHPVAIFSTEETANAWLTTDSPNRDSSTIGEVILDDIGVILPQGDNTASFNFYLISRNNSFLDVAALIASVIPTSSNGAPAATDSYAKNWRDAHEPYASITPVRLVTYRTVTFSEVTILS